MARKLPSISTSSMSDISFLLLTFFLLTSSITNEQGIPRLMPKISDQTKEHHEEINQRNMLKILVNMNDDIYITGAEYTSGKEIKNRDIQGQLKEIAKKFLVNEKTRIVFLANPNNSPDYPEKEDKIIEGIGHCMVSKGVISLVSDNSTTYKTYILVQNELQKAVNELRDEFALNHFGQPYEKLASEEQKAVQQAVPINISETFNN